MTAVSAPGDVRLGRGRRSSLYQPSEPAFGVYVAIVAASAVYAWSQQRVFSEISPAGWALSWFLLVLYALPLAIAVYALDLYEREPLSLVVGAFVWGAIAATSLSAIANEGWGLVVARAGGPEFASRWTAALTAPFVEETMKVAGVVLIYQIARDEMDDLMDGFVYGAMCGLGFAIVEDVFYFVSMFGGTSGGVLAGFYVRVVSSGLYGHVLYTGLSGMAVASFVSSRGRSTLRRRVAISAALLLTAVAGHFLWNSPLLDVFPSGVHGVRDVLMIPVAAAVKGVPLLIVVIVLVKLARRRESRWLEAALRSETHTPAVTTTELGILLDPAARRRSRRDMRARAGEGASKLLRRLQREQINLAMLHTRAATDTDPALLAQRELCASLRSALAAMPGAAPAGS
jgi:RsiW-degrading membrane proteinase PrsW (M82 family)